MSKFYDDAQKWQLYVRHRRGRTLTQLQDETGITDKPLRAWFRAFDAQLSCPDNQDLLRLQEELRALREQHRQTTAELEAVRTIVQQALPEFTRFQAACRWIPVYGPNLTCRLFGIRKSNFYYRTQRRPAKTQNQQRDEVLRPLVEKLYLRSGKRISSEAIRQKLLDQGISISKRKVLSFLREWKADKETTSARMSAAAARRRFCHLNLLDRQFNPEAPNKAWVSDITELHYAGASSTCALCWTYSPARSWQPGPPTRMTPPWWPGPLRPPFSGEDGPVGCFFTATRAGNTPRIISENCWRSSVSGNPFRRPAFPMTTPSWNPFLPA